MRIVTSADKRPPATENGSEDANASMLFGMTGFVVRAQTKRENEWWLAVETTATTRAACPSCGVFGIANGRRRVQVRDLPIAGDAVVIVRSKRILCQAGCRHWFQTDRTNCTSSTR